MGCASGRGRGGHSRSSYVKTRVGYLLNSWRTRGLYYVGNLCFLRVTVTFGFICRVFLFGLARRLLQPTIISPPSVCVCVCFLNAAVFVVSVIKLQNSVADEAHPPTAAALTPPRAWQTFLRLHPDVAELLGRTACPAKPGDVAAPIIPPTCSCAQEALAGGGRLPAGPRWARA